VTIAEYTPEKEREKAGFVEEIARLNNTIDE
jgi:hypothetical protein